VSAVVLAVLLWLPQSGSGEFTISVNGMTLGSEQFSILRSDGGFVATGRTRLRVNGGSVEAESRMRLDAELNPLSYEYTSGGQSLRLDIGAEVARVEVTVDGEATSYDIVFPAGGMIVDDNFFHHYLLLLDRVGEDGGSLQVFVPQQLTVGMIEVRPAGERTYDLTTENLRLRASTDAEGRLVRLVGLDTNVVVER
jgi:hypothetical protein